MSMEPEPTIEPMVQPEAVVKTEPVEDDVVKAESSDKKPSAHSYSTRSKDTLTPLQIKQKQHNVIVQSRLKPVPFNANDLLIGPPVPQKVAAATIESIEFFQSDDHPFNRRGFKYKPCQPNPLFKSNLYLTTDLEPYGVCVSHFDRSSGILFNEDMNKVSTSQGWRSARTNIGIREGKYYFEFNIINASNGSGHVRVGLGRKEASLEAPVGFDGYSYGIRDVTGQRMTLSRPKDFMEGFQSGDVLGFLIEFPDLETHKKAVEVFTQERVKQIEKEVGKRKKTDTDQEPLNTNGNIVRDQIPIKYKSALYYEQFEYTPTKQMDHLLNPVTVFGEQAIMEEKNNLLHSSNNLPTIPDSKITVFKNGVDVGVMAENIYSFLPATFYDHKSKETVVNSTQLTNPAYKNTDDGELGYYPMMSVFLNGVVGINPGPHFKYPQEGVQPLSDRYDERIVEEWLWDLVDEVECDYLDSFDV